MDTKPLLYGLIGFMLGGLLVSVVATTIERDEPPVHSAEMTMSSMTDELREKTGDDYDKAFIDSMILHHQAALDMAKLSSKQAKHQEIKDLSDDIISAQNTEITQMKEWRAKWYGDVRSTDAMQQMH